MRLVAGDLSPYAGDVARTIAAAVDGDDDPHVMVVGAGAGGVVAAELAAQRRPLPFVVDQVVTAGAPAAQVPRLPAGTRMLALEDRADPVALLGSLVSAGDANRTTVVFDAAGSSLGERLRRRRPGRRRLPRAWSPSSTGCAGWATSPGPEWFVRLSPPRLVGLRGCRARTRPAG